MYDMLSGAPPFTGDDRKQTIDLILRGDFVLVPYLSREASSLLTKLLVVDVNRRLGSGPSDAEAIKSHPFFRSTNWEQVLNRKADPPFRPTLTSDTDVSQFDPKFTQENPVESPDEGVPISSVMNDVFEGFTYVDPQVQIDMARDPWVSQWPSCSRSRRRSGISGSSSPGFVGHTIMASTGGLILGGSSHGIPHAGTPHPDQSPRVIAPGGQNQLQSQTQQQQPFVFAEDFEDMDVTCTALPGLETPYEGPISQPNAVIVPNIGVLPPVAQEGGFNCGVRVESNANAVGRGDRPQHMNGVLNGGHDNRYHAPRSAAAQASALAAVALATSSRLANSNRQLPPGALNFNSPLTRPLGSHPTYCGQSPLRGPVLKKSPLPATTAEQPRNLRH
jgi:hypothetical protein